ncbi:MAG: lipoprotein-releasing system permease protein [Saprospiraceae bacterium]|jgi:lipoprotein-releasing system permease protein
MNLPHFVAKRIAFSRSRSFTKVIVRIAIAAIALSLTIMILTTMIINGFKNEISTKVFGFWGHIHITDINVNRSFEQIPISKTADYIPDIEDIEWLEYQTPVKVLGYELAGRYTTTRTNGGVKHVQPFVYTAGIIKTKKDFGAIQIKGVDEKFDWNYLPNFIIEGEALDLKNEVSSGIIVSSFTARQMQLKVGQRIKITTLKNNESLNRAFIVKGIYNTGLEEYDKQFAIIDMRKAQDMLQWNEDDISGIEVFLEDIADLDIINEYLYNDVVPGRIYAETISSKFPSIFEWLKLQDINENLLLYLMVIVAVINMITALLILILERTHMIGLLKALGSTNWQIRKIFLYNAGYIIFSGIIVGNILGLGIGYLQYSTHFITLDEASYYLSYAPILFNWEAIILINFFCFLFTIMFLILPTYLVTSISPIKTLRFE